jgi:arylsulfatase A-like enzyme
MKPASAYPGSQDAGKDFSYPVDNFNAACASPFGNVMLTDLALEALKNEDLGKDEHTDLITISYSSPDAVGHTFGPLSKEVNDLYLRLDADIARLLDALDKQVGKDNYLLFLTADHGIADVPQYLTDHKVPAGYVKGNILKPAAAAFLNKKLGEGNWIEYEINEQFYLNHTLINEKGLSLESVQDLLAGFLRNQQGIFQVYTAKNMQEESYVTPLASKLQAGYLFKRSGDVLYTYEPGWTEYMTNGSTHGSGYSYDTQVPLIWYGSGIRQGSSFMKYDITDIVATIVLRLGIKPPHASTGKGIPEVLR